MTEPVYIDNWCTRPARSPYTAPEMDRRIILSGFVTGHPNHPDGHEVDTSVVADVRGRMVTTVSGRVYRLGRPSRKWLAWLRETGKPYDPKHPIRDMRTKGSP